MEENASNALVMAGGILLGIMIISLAVFVFTYSADFAKNYEKTNEATSIATFNRQFEVYNRDNLTIHDIITVRNLAREINLQNEVNDNEDSIYHITVAITGLNYSNSEIKTNHLETLSDNKIIDLLNNSEISQNNGIIKKYKCEKIDYIKLENLRINRVWKLVFVEMKT